MASRLEIAPHHVLRAVLEVALVREVLQHLGAPPDDLRATLDMRLLESIDSFDDEVLEARGVSLTTLLAALNPPLGAVPDWDGRHLTPAARDALVGGLREAARRRGQSVNGGHVLLGLMTSRLVKRDPVVAGTLREYPLRVPAVRTLVDRWGRRVT